ncbi:MAG: aminotransferase class IV [Actinomycetota bacterium]
MSPAPYRPEDLPDPRNAGIVIYVDGDLVPRDEARVSVFDSSVQGGDAVWEGLRVYDGKIFALDRHLDRLFASAHSLRFDGVPSRETVREAVVETFVANGMYDDAHARLTLTRGPKVTSGMSPTNNRAGCTLIVLAEWKPPVFGTGGLRLITSSVRRNSPATLDSKIHHNNLLNNILAKIEADVAGVDEALMLDLHGFVSETNATNVFAARAGRLLTPSADACLPGITRGIVLELASKDGIDVVERNVSLSELYTADEVFTTGTMGELAHVVEIDGRSIGTGVAGPVTERLRALHRQLCSVEGEPLPKRP